MIRILNLPMHLVHEAIQQSRKLLVRVVLFGSLAVLGLGVARIGAVFLPYGLSDSIELRDLPSFEQDPRFGVLVSGEMASKALSPWINDAGTAIDIMTRLTKVSCYFKEETGTADAKYDRVNIRPMKAAELIESGFSALARDGASVVEVQIRLQKAMASLRRCGDPAMREAALAFARVELRRALDAIQFEGDRVKLLAQVDPQVQQS